MIQCTIQIFHHYFKSRNDNILVIKHTLYICFIYLLPLRMIILFYGEYIVHLHCQRTGRVIHTKIVYICFTQAYVYCIAYFPFHSVFHSVPFSVPFSVPRFSNTLGHMLKAVYFSIHCHRKGIYLSLKEMFFLFHF